MKKLFLLLVTVASTTSFGMNNQIQYGEGCQQTTPRAKCRLNFDDVDIKKNDQQYEQALTCEAAMDKAINELELKDASQLLSYLMYLNNDDQLLFPPEEFVNRPQHFQNCINWFKEGRGLHFKTSNKVKATLSICLNQLKHFQPNRITAEDRSTLNKWTQSAEKRLNHFYGAAPLSNSLEKLPKIDKENKRIIIKQKTTDGSNALTESKKATLRSMR